MITRRLFLRNSAAAGAVVATVAAPSVAEAAVQPPSANERFDAALADLQKAAEEMDPRIGMWRVSRVDDANGRCPLVISAHRYTGRYEGDGLYEAAEENALGKHTQYRVALLEGRIDGQRTFSVRTSMDRLTLTEPALSTFIGRRVS